MPGKGNIVRKTYSQQHNYKPCLFWQTKINSWGQDIQILEAFKFSTECASRNVRGDLYSLSVCKAGVQKDAAVV